MGFRVQACDVLRQQPEALTPNPKTHSRRQKKKKQEVELELEDLILGCG